MVPNVPDNPPKDGLQKLDPSTKLLGWMAVPRGILEGVAAKLGIGPEIAWETGWSFALKAANTGLGFLTTVLLARMLGAEGYGIYAYAYALVMLLAMPAQAGLPNLIVRETARGMAEGRSDRVQGAWQWAGRVVGVLSLIVVVGVGPFLIAWQGGLSSPQGQTLAWALALVPLMALGNLRGAALRGLRQIIAGQLPEFVIRPGAFLLLVGAVAWLTRRRLVPAQAMAMYAAASLAAFLLGAWMLWQRTPPSVRQSERTIENREWLTSSVLFALISGFGVVNRQVSTVILGIFKAPDQVGIYRVAVQVATLASFGLNAVNMVMAPRFADLYARGDQARLQRLVTGGARVVLVSNLVLTMLFVLLGRPFFRLVFGSEFDASYMPLLIMLAGQTVNSAAGPVGYLLNMTGHERETARGMAAAAALNIILNLLLTPIWGIRGAAAATAISMIAWNALLWWRVRKALGVDSLAFRNLRPKRR